MIFFIFPFALLVAAIIGGIWQVAGTYILWYIGIGIVLIMLFGFKRVMLFAYIRAAFFAGKSKGLVIDTETSATMSLKDWYYSENVYEIRNEYPDQHRFDKEIIRFVRYSKLPRFKGKAWLFMTPSKIEKSGGLQKVIADYKAELSAQQDAAAAAQECF